MTTWGEILRDAQNDKVQKQILRDAQDDRPGTRSFVAALLRMTIWSEILRFAQNDKVQKQILRDAQDDRVLKMILLNLILWL